MRIKELIEADEPSNPSRRRFLRTAGAAAAQAAMPGGLVKGILSAPASTPSTTKVAQQPQSEFIGFIDLNADGQLFVVRVPKNLAQTFLKEANRIEQYDNAYFNQHAWEFISIPPNSPVYNEFSFLDFLSEEDIEEMKMIGTKDYVYMDFMGDKDNGYELRRGNEVVTCDDVVTMESEQSFLQEVFDEWKAAAEEGEEGYTYNIEPISNEATAIKAARAWQEFIDALDIDKSVIVPPEDNFEFEYTDNGIEVVFHNEDDEDDNEDDTPVPQKTTSMPTATNTNVPQTADTLAKTAARSAVSGQMSSGLGAGFLRKMIDKITDLAKDEPKSTTAAPTPNKPVTPALPAPVVNPDDIITQMQSELGRPLNDQEKAVVRQEVSDKNKESK